MRLAQYLQHLCPTRPTLELDPPLPCPTSIKPYDQDKVFAAVQARVDEGMKPWPSLSDSDYFNEVIGTCAECGGKIYGGMAISYGYDQEGNSETRCKKHWK